MPSGKDSKWYKQEILKVAEDITSCQKVQSSDTNRLTAFFRLEGIISKFTTAEEANDSALFLLDLGILQLACQILKEDFSKPPNTVNSGVRLGALFSKIVANFSSKPVKDEFRKCAAEGVENLLVLAKHVQDRYLLIPAITQYVQAREETLQHFTKVLEAVELVALAHLHLCKTFFSSTWLLRLLITDDADSSMAVMATVRNIIKSNSEALVAVDDTVLDSILDELIYKLSVSNNAAVGRATCKTVIFLAESSGKVQSSINNHFKGLKLLLSRWKGKGFFPELHQLLRFVEADSSKLPEWEIYHEAATVIQAAYRGHRDRKKLQTIKKSFSQFLYKWRQARDNRQKAMHEDKQLSILREQLLASRRAALRKLREKQLACIELLPAAEVNLYLANEQIHAATRIQSSWRGYETRKNIHLLLEERKFVKQVIVIQRAVRKWLSRKQSKKKKELSVFVSHIPDERRVQLQQQISAWQETHWHVAGSREGLEETHKKAQDMLANYVINHKNAERQSDHISSVIARIKCYEELLENAPSLKMVSDADVTNFTNNSTAIATKARIAHNEMLNKTKQRWWEKLDQDDDKEEPYLDNFFQKM